MAYTDAKKASDKKYHAKLDHIKIQPSKEDGVRIRKAAADAGLSVQRFILTLVLAYIDDDDKEDV